MSFFEEGVSEAGQRQFDRLVDGELSEADRRTLLLQLEHEPEGWRRCALAFLEAQCWKEGFGQIGGPVSPGTISRAAISPAQIPPQISEGSPSPLPAAPLPAARQPVDWQRWRQYAATLLTISASFLLALFVGMGLRGKDSGLVTHGSDTAANLSPANLSPTVGPLPASGVAQSQVPAGQLAGVQAPTVQVPTGQASPAQVPVAAAQVPTANGGWEMVSVAAADSPDGRAQTYFVPAQCRDTLDPSLIPDTIPAEVRQAFEESGHQIVQQREIVPVPMKDGRRLMVPVDHVEIHYVGRQTF
jgi:hypothetical protein